MKYAASRLGLCSPRCACRWCPIAEASEEIVDAALAKVGLIQARAAE